MNFVFFTPTRHSLNAFSVFSTYFRERYGYVSGGNDDQRLPFLQFYLLRLNNSSIIFLYFNKHYHIHQTTTTTTDYYYILNHILNHILLQSYSITLNHILLYLTIIPPYTITKNKKNNIKKSQQTSRIQSPINTHRFIMLTVPPPILILHHLIIFHDSLYTPIKYNHYSFFAYLFLC